jgi:hypothetical protein
MEGRYSPPSQDLKASERDSGVDISIGLRVAAPAEVEVVLFEEVEGALLDGDGGDKRFGESQN